MRAANSPGLGGGGWGIPANDIHFIQTTLKGTRRSGCRLRPWGDTSVWVYLPASTPTTAATFRARRFRYRSMGFL